MFTPQRKAPWTPATSTPRNDPRTNPRQSWTPATLAKGKVTAFLDAPPLPPPTGSLSVSEAAEYEGGNPEDWRRFKEVGLLDECDLERKDRQAMLDRVSRLEKELFDYQYNMGLLLMEKKNLVSKTEELRQELSEAEEILKRERAAHLIAFSDAEKREENLKKALQVERRSLVDLERALRDMHEEHAKGKATSETTMADLNVRMEELQILNLDVEKRSRNVDAKLAESDRKNSELDRKLQDLEVHENILQREQLSFTQERESHELYYRKQKEDLLEWEKKLQEGEQRLCESRRILNEREEKLHEIDISSKVKESNIEELQKKIDLANETLKKVEDDVKNQLVDLDMKEKKAEAIKWKLEEKEKQLQEEEERLNARETMELEKLVNEHKVMLDEKMHEFDLEMKQKKIAFDEEMISRKEALNQKETEINHLELKLGKRETALEKKSERLKDKEKDFEVKNKTLREQEKCLKAEVKNLEVEKEQVIAEKERLETLKKEIEMLRDDARKQELHIEEELKNLEVVERERLEYLRLQSSLKQEIDNVRRQSELIEKEAADLKLERMKFEKDWEALDEKRSVVDNELQTLTEKKAYFEKSKNLEEERLKRERTENEERLRLESESIRLQKESFEATMNQEKLLLVEEAKNKQALMQQDFEQQRQDLYNDMQKRREEWGKMVEEKERALEELRLREMSNFKHLKEDAEKNKGEMEVEWRHMEKEKEELELNKIQFEETRVEISKDIKALDSLSKKLKKQREQLLSERVHFGALIEKIKCCKNCGDSAQEFLCSIIQLPTVRLSQDDQKDAKDRLGPLPGAVDRQLPQIGGQTSVLRKCASIIFNLSPKKGTHSADNPVMEESPLSATHMQINEHAREQTSTGDEVNTRAGTSDAMNMSQSDVRDDHVDNSLTVDEVDNASDVQGTREPEKSRLRNVQRKSGSRRGPGVRRTHSVKAVVEEAKAILRDGSLGKMEVKPNDSVGTTNVNNEEKTLHVDMTNATSTRKRSRSQASKVTESEQDVDHSEGNADSVTTGSRRKKQQTVSSTLPTPGQRRYNLRRHTAAASSGKPEEDEFSRKDTNQAVQNPDETPSQSLDIADESDRRLHLVQVSITRSIELSSDRCNAAANVTDNQVDTAKSAENTFIGEVKTAENTLLSEVNGILDNVEEDSRSMVNEKDDDKEFVSDNDTDDDDDNDNDEEEDDDDDDDHPGQASVGKKLWKFFTS